MPTTPIAGLEQSTWGTVLINGEPAHGPGTYRILIFQELGLFPWLTVADNVEFGVKMKGILKQERKQKAECYLRLVQLSQFADSYIHQLSGGMRQRIGRSAWRPGANRCRRSMRWRGETWAHAG